MYWRFVQVVCVNEIRPEIPPRWHSTETLRTLLKVLYIKGCLG